MQTTAEQTWAALELPAALRTLAASETIRPSPEALASRPPTLPAIAVTDADGGAADHAEVAIDGVLGEGGMSVVYRGTQRSLLREVAVKRARAGSTPASSQLAQRSLVHEARIAGRLEHPNIIPVHMLGLDPAGAPALVMKRVEGVPWRALIHDGAHPFWAHTDAGEDRLPWHVRTLMQVCMALELAHAHGIVHRDIKPDNVMVGRFGEVYVLDWGIAVNEGYVSSEPGGTPAYMAREMIAGDPITPRTDVYLLGACLYEVLAGRPPHQADTFLLSVASIWKNEVRVDAPCPPELAAICERAMETRPEGRYATARALRTALAGFLNHRESTLLSDEAWTRLHALLARLQAGEGATQEALEPIEQTATEVRFAFRHALRIWGDNARAQEGLDRLLRALFERAIAQRDIVRARALRKEIGGALPAFDAQLAQLEAALRAEARELVALRDAARERDPSEQAAFRVRTLKHMAAWLLALGAVMSVWRHLAGYRPSVEVVTLGHALLALAPITMRFLRPPENQWNRSMAASFIAATVAAALACALCWRFGGSGELALAMALAVFALATLHLSLTLIPGSPLGSAPYFVAVAVGAAWPAVLLEAGLLAIVASLLYTARVWAPMTTAAASEAGGQADPQNPQ